MRSLRTSLWNAYYHHFGTIAKHSQLCVTTFDRTSKADSIGLSKRETCVDTATSIIALNQEAGWSLRDLNMHLLTGVSKIDSKRAIGTVSPYYSTAEVYVTWYDRYRPSRWGHYIVSLPQNLELPGVIEAKPLGTCASDQHRHCH